VSDIKEKHGLGLSQNRVLRRIFGPKMNKKLVNQRKLHDKEFRNFYGLPKKIWNKQVQMMKLVGHRAPILGSGEKVGRKNQYDG
jgi:hypothetical protein